MGLKLKSKLKNKNQKKEKKVDNEVDEPPKKRKKEMPTKDNKEKQEPPTPPSKKGKKEKKDKAKRKVDDESGEPPKKRKKEMPTKDDKEKPEPPTPPSNKGNWIEAVERRKEEKERSLFLRKCPESITAQLVEEHYNRVVGPGTVQKVTWATSHDGKFKGYGFALLASLDLCRQALRADPPKVNGQAIAVYGCSKNTQEIAAKAVNERKGSKQDNCLFMGKCPDSITNDDLYQHYGALGEGAIVNVIWIGKGDSFKGYGFVYFKDADTKFQALMMPPPQVAGRTLDVKETGKKRTEFELFMGGLHGTDASADLIEDYYNTQLGVARAVSNCRIFTNNSGESRGCGYISFKSKELMEKAWNLDPPYFGPFQMKLERPGQAAPKKSEEKSNANIEKEIIVRFCPALMTDDDLHQHYASLGKDPIAKIQWTKKRDIAFVQFKSPRLKEEALAMSPPMVDFNLCKVEANYRREQKQ
eukprot:CAMPEP_0174310078 /NCGR_PEP_ID=MMETSP0810-20121108/2820_1 /TAXON_ID=73025 ORGANISM="Eutreptiella gymnastica-like, Strain CCMP1594" /NCGR_SAMPLE_ID=MMETSP0810 /ASSEMBLY_ACC=CAM_ASM_000659 /LENGTH=471 /DNA_ID=CAMNT_0015417891 /DNA_START=26 /DNA_END=1444 /DNA_ORIENTATION=+